MLTNEQVQSNHPVDCQFLMTDINLRIRCGNTSISNSKFKWKNVMKAKLIEKKGQKQVVIYKELEDDFMQYEDWVAGIEGDVFQVYRQKGKNIIFSRIGSLEELANEPINVSFKSSDPGIKILSNLAHTPFELDGRHYESVEGFWQGLKFPEEQKRLEIAQLWGFEAKRAARDARKRVFFKYEGEKIRMGSREHWILMAKACIRKFQQNDDARKALLNTKNRPLIHKTKRDSRTIPGAIMADIYMNIRRRHQKQLKKEYQ